MAAPTTSQTTAAPTTSQTSAAPTTSQTSARPDARQSDTRQISAAPTTGVATWTAEEYENRSRAAQAAEDLRAVIAFLDGMRTAKRFLASIGTEAGSEALEPDLRQLSQMSLKQLLVSQIAAEQKILVKLRQIERSAYFTEQRSLFVYNYNYKYTFMSYIYIRIQLNIILISWFLSTFTCPFIHLWL